MHRNIWQCLSKLQVGSERSNYPRFYITVRVLLTGSRIWDIGKKKKRRITGGKGRKVGGIVLGGSHGDTAARVEEYCGGV